MKKSVPVLAVKPLKHVPVRMSVDQNILYNKPSIDISLPTQPGKTAAKENEPKLPTDVIKWGTMYRCSVCNLALNSLIMVKEHANGKRHLRTKIYAELSKRRANLQKSKNNVKVTSEGKEDGILKMTYNLDKKKQTERLPVTIENMGRTTVHVNMAFLKDKPFYRLICNEKQTGLRPIAVDPGHSMTFHVKILVKKVGYCNTSLVMRFRRDDLTDFHIMRDIRTRVVNEIILESDPKVKYTPPQRVSVMPITEVIDGERPKTKRADDLEKKLELKNYPIQKMTRAAVNHSIPIYFQKNPSVGEEGLRIRTLTNLEAKTPEQQFQEYHQRFTYILHIEELQMEVDIRTYDMKGVPMKRDGKLLELKVPGLSENRPSVLRGDSIFVRICGKGGDPEETEYKGYVHQVQLDSVLIGFNNKLIGKFIDNMKFNVRFTFNRLPLKLQHRATEQAVEHNLRRLLFPTPETVAKWDPIMDPSPRNKMVFYDRNIEANKEQATAVRHIVAGTSRPAPYLIFGPPGTGKTVTIVEAIKQVLRCLPKANVLACAPSNSAADLITQRLIKHVPKKQIFRMHAASRNWNDVPDEVKEVSNYDKRDGDYYYPLKDEICKKWRVVVTTLVTAGRLASANFPPNHFTHVFIDEAGHAFESEAVISIAGILENDKKICKDGGQLVLAGDPKQLGPIVRSPFAKEFGLDISLLERLMETSEPYKRNPSGDIHYDQRVLTKLVDNYRSHPAILELPNKLFYDGELKVCADQVVREALCNWSELPKKNFPIIFHGVAGKEVREGHSPSFFNPEEVSVVHDFVVKLLNARGMIKLKETNIGIIAPYRQQVSKIRQALKKRGFKNIKVGSVEEFQGQERMVIIISAVRSQVEYLEEDVKFKLGFLANAKKYNVATTRAKALMIVVGNPKILQFDPADCWNRLISYCQKNGGYQGLEFLSLDEEVNQLREALSELKLDFSSGVPELVSAASEVQEQVHPEWRGQDRV